MLYNEDLEYSYDSNDEYMDERQLRRERMKQEKKRQAAKRAMMRKALPMLILGIVVLVALVSVIVWGIKALTNKKEPVIEQPVISEEVVVTPEVTPEPIPTRAPVKNMINIDVALPNMFEGYEVDGTQATSAISEEDVQSQYASLINATTGKAIVSKNGRDRMNPASMTKVMTVLVASEHITDLEEMFTITLEDTDFAYVNDLSCAGFEADETVPVKDILYGAILPSGGECCHALERLCADSEEEFIQMMNDKAKELGLNGTHFTNSAGLYNENHYTTLFDMSMIMKAAIEDDICRQVLHEHMKVTTSTTQHPEGIELSNWFMRRIEDKYTKTEVMGAKTGYVYQSGNCAVSYTIGSDGTVYIAATGNAHSAWRAIYDHVSLYNKYVDVE